MFNFERNEIWDPSLLGRGVRHKILYPRFALLNWHCWSTFDLSQILVSSDTQLLSKPELMTHPQSLLGWYFVLELKLNYLMTSCVHGVLQSWRRLVSWFIQTLYGSRVYNWVNSNLSRPDSKRRLDIQSMCSLEGALTSRSGLPVFELSTDLSQLEQA